MSLGNLPVELISEILEYVLTVGSSFDIEIEDPVYRCETAITTDSESSESAVGSNHSSVSRAEFEPHYELPSSNSVTGSISQEDQSDSCSVCRGEIHRLGAGSTFPYSYQTFRDSCRIVRDSRGHSVCHRRLVGGQIGGCFCDNKSRVANDNPPSCVSGQVLRVCQLFYRIGIGMLYSKNRFVFQDLWAMRRLFLDYIPTKNIELVRHIRFRMLNELIKREQFFSFFYGPKAHPKSNCDITFGIGPTWFSYNALHWYGLRSLKHVDFHFSWEELLHIAARRLDNPRSEDVFETSCTEIEIAARLFIRYLSEARGTSFEQADTKATAVPLGEQKHELDFDTFLFKLYPDMPENLTKPDKEFVVKNVKAAVEGLMPDLSRYPRREKKKIPS